MQTTVAYDIFSHKLDYTFFNNKICYAQSYEQITRDLAFQGQIINDLERKLGKNNKEIFEKKKFYTLVELEHLEFVQKLNTECNQGIETILFFYSNEEKDLDRSESVGRILDTVYEKNPEKLVIYSFDINLDSQLILNLKEKYGITVSPTVVIKDNKIIDPKNINELDKYLS